MSNYDMTTAANLAKVSNKPTFNVSAFRLIKRVITLADLATIKASAAAGTDTFDLLPITAGMVVLSTAIRTLVPVSGGSVSSPTIALGDQSAADFQSATAVDAAAQTYVAGSGTYLQKATDPYNLAGGKFYSAANTLRATLGGTWTAATAGSFEVYMTVADLGISLSV
jgi:hypothetical protein